MNGDTAGVESTDPGGEGDTLRRLRSALTLFNSTAKAACDLSEHKLQREAEDAAARIVREIQVEEAAARERLSRSEALHGEDPQAA